MLWGNGSDFLNSLVCRDGEHGVDNIAIKLDHRHRAFKIMTANEVQRSC